MERSCFNVYKKLKNKIKNQRAFIDIIFLNINESKVKGTNYLKLFYERDKGFKLIEFKKNIYGYNTYISYDDSLKNIINDGSKEYNLLSYSLKTLKTKNTMKDFKLDTLKLSRGYNISSFSKNDKLRNIQYLSLLEGILSSNDDSKIFLDTLVILDQGYIRGELPRNFGTMLVLYDPKEFTYHVATDTDLRPVVDSLYQIKGKTNEVLADLSGFKNAEFDYYINFNVFKNEKTNEVYALFCIGDNNTKESLIAHKVFKVDNKLKNLPDIICSALYLFFEEYGIPTVINTVSPILYEYLLPLYKNGIEVAFNYNPYYTALMRHITNLMVSYITKYEITDFNLNDDLINKFFIYFKYLLINSFNPLEHYLIENEYELYTLFDDFYKEDDNLEKDLEEDIENDAFIN